MLLAQAETVGRLVDKTANSAADYGLIGLLLVLLLCGMGLALWRLSRFLERRDDLERVSREKSETQFLAALKDQRDKADQQISAQRDQSDKQITEQRKQGLELAKSGQLAVTVLAEAFHELNLLLCQESGGGGISESAIHRRREARRKASESVLE